MSRDETPQGPVSGQETVRRWQEAVLRRAARDHENVFGEVAREVLAGRMTMREAATGYAYRDVFAEAGQQVIAAVRGKTSEQLRAAAERHPLEQLVERLERDETPADTAADTAAAVSAPDPVDDEPPASVLRGAPRTTTDAGDQPARRQRWQRRWH